MYTNNAYLNDSHIDRKDKSNPLIVTMCGTYKLYTKPKLPTLFRNHRFSRVSQGRVLHVPVGMGWKTQLFLFILTALLKGNS